ncbi:hypothetical protein INT47_013279 [Mucor saturninus]|uniref:Uncharacterized protein n=1 Tax=Mucor saturninus TaxID=64648 RepID=A0A8H7UMA1_9FUNG|nr:hypothetical protein INT47_013279 [Mucor saturninus]
MEVILTLSREVSPYILSGITFASSTAFEVTEDDPAGNIEPEFFLQQRMFDAWVARRRTAEQPAEEREEDSADEADADVEALYFAENSARGQSNTVPNSATPRREPRNNRNTDVSSSEKPPVRGRGRPRGVRRNRGRPSNACRSTAQTGTSSNNLETPRRQSNRTRTGRN